MTETTATAPTGDAKGLPARLIGVLVAPRATYAHIAARPRWFGALLFIVLVGGLATFTFLSTDVGREAVLDQQMDVMNALNIQISDQQMQRIEQGMQFARYTGPIGQAIGVSVVSVIVAGIMLGIFNAVLGGDAGFKQVYAVVVHSYVVTTIATVVKLSIGYGKGTMSGLTNLALFAPFLDDNSMPAHFLGAIDLFWIWWIVSLSIGMGVVYKRRTGPIATTLLGIYVAGALVYALVRAAIAGA